MSLSVQNGPSASPLPSSNAKPDKVDHVSKLLNTIKDHDISPELSLKALWGDKKVFGEGLVLLNALREKCATNTDHNATQTRLEVTQALLKSNPSLQGLSSRIERALTGNAQDVDGHVSGEIRIYLAARDMVSKSLDNVAFTFLHLVTLAVKGAVTDKISAAIARFRGSDSDAREAAFSHSVNREAQFLLKSHIKSPTNAGVTTPAPAEDLEISDAAKPAFTAFMEVLKGLPISVLGHENWPQVEKRLIAYFNHTVNIQGDDFVDLLKSIPKTGEGKLMDCLNSMEFNSKLDHKTARQMAFQRELWNIGQSKRPTARQNKQVIGWAESFANRCVKTSKPGQIPDVLKPGNQLSLAIETPLMRSDKKIVNVTILSFVAPALDSPTQPEYSSYAKWEDIGPNGHPGVTEFYSDVFRKAYTTIRNQAIAFSNAHPEKTEFAITGVGLGAYLHGLAVTDEKGNSDNRLKNEAREIGARALAELTIDLRKLGKQVVFTDVDDTIMTIVNTELEKIGSDQKDRNLPDLTKRIELKGQIPGNWINPGTVIFNAWDTHSLLGNMLKNDPTIDGHIGRATLIHPFHALRCAMEAEGILLS